MLEVRNLDASVREDDKAILKGLDLSVPAGEAHTIMGPNGSGKSTLSRVLTGRAGRGITDGEIAYEGADLSDMELARVTAGVQVLALHARVEIDCVAYLPEVEQ